MSIQDDPKCHDFWGSDKWRHIGVWFGGTLGIYLFFKSVVKTSKLTSFVLSAAVMSVIGVAREISDSNSEKNCFSEQDLFANSLGILSAGIVIAIF
jgi:EamA domain-containing membrane protein RarD